MTISHHCFLVWERFDRAGLEAWVALHGKIRVRVQVPRQRWPAGTMVAAGP
jgi:hypothetical protein